MGFVAVSGRAGAHTGEAHKEGCQCVAFAEVDKTRWGGVSRQGRLETEAKGYTDWREMFGQAMASELDVVFVATPSDHTYYAPSMTAVSTGNHCYTEKLSDLVCHGSTQAYRCLRQTKERRYPNGKSGSR